MNQTLSKRVTILLTCMEPSQPRMEFQKDYFDCEHLINLGVTGALTLLVSLRIKQLQTRI